MSLPLDYARLKEAFGRIASAESQEGVGAMLVAQAQGLLGAREALLGDRRHLPRAAGPILDTRERLSLKDPRAWEGLEGEFRLYDLGGDAPWVALRLSLRVGEEVALLLRFAEGSVPGDEVLTVLPLLASHAQARALYLHANAQAAEAQAKAQEAHEQQMEMALRLYDLYEEAQNQAITDGLTGLATHDFFQQRLAQEFREATRYEKPLSFLIVDLDHFKSINDNHGHQAGDLVLKQTALMLKDKVRGSDLVARYGGEEMAIILPNTDEEDAYQLAERLRATLEGMSFQITEERAIKVTTSVGLASRSEHDLQAKDLIKRADVALYAAKNGGRNRVVRAKGPAVEAVSAIGAPRAGSQEMFYTLAKAFAATIEARIPMLHGHSESVGAMARAMGARMGLGEDKQEALYIAGLLHDVGMMSVPESVIFKPGKLSDGDWAKMREHPAAGVGILARFGTFSGLLEAVLYHHERFDGRGYPEGLKASAIPMGARILAICDSYDAMVRGDYAYGEGMPPEQAAAEIVRCGGSQFDPELVPIFEQVLAEEPKFKHLRSPEVSSTAT